MAHSAHVRPPVAHLALLPAMGRSPQHKGSSTPTAELEPHLHPTCAPPSSGGGALCNLLPACCKLFVQSMAVGDDHPPSLESFRYCRERIQAARGERQGHRRPPPSISAFFLRRQMHGRGGRRMRAGCREPFGSARPLTPFWSRRPQPSLQTARRLTTLRKRRLTRRRPRT